nr:hypothetical protein [Micromonospora sp. DSM 115978]
MDPTESAAFVRHSRALLLRTSIFWSLVLVLAAQVVVFLAVIYLDFGFGDGSPGLLLLSSWIILNCLLSGAVGSVLTFSRGSMRRPVGYPSIRRGTIYLEGVDRSVAEEWRRLNRDIDIK